MAGECSKLKWHMRNTFNGISDREFGKLVGTDQLTIRKLRHDDEYWNQIPQDLSDKIHALYKPMAKVQPDGMNETICIVDDVEEPSIETEGRVEPVESEVNVYTNGLNEQNQKSMTLIEFIFDGLNESKSHADFLANIGLLKRVLSKY